MFQMEAFRSLKGNRVSQHSSANPCLRALDIRPFRQRGEMTFLLRDPLNISDQALVVPRALGPALLLCDGTRDVSAICAELIDSYGVVLPPLVIEEMITALDSALLLDNNRFAQACIAAIAEYRSAPFRPLSHAGAVYPDDSGELAALLNNYLDHAQPGPAATRAIFSPHIDYARGGLVYGSVWGGAAQLAAEAEVVIVLATDHAPGKNLITLTRQQYATPFGVLPTDQEIVEALADAIGQESAFADELHHRGEHSIELVAVWLHHMRMGKPCRLVPILCGSFAPFVRGEADLASDPTIMSLVTTLRDVLRDERVIIVASGDLSHVGPAFGGAALDRAGWDAIKQFDHELIERLCVGDADEFFSYIKQANDHTNVCGVPPFYLALKALGEQQGSLAAYERCSADADSTSLVSVGGIVY